MIDTPCDLLDDFLSDRLRQLDRAQFERHLAGCPKCQQALCSQQRIDRLLASAEAELGTVPRGLIERIEQQVQRSARRVRLRRVFSLSAAAALVALGTWLILPQLKESVRQAPTWNREQTGPAVVEQPRQPSSSDSPDSIVAVRLTFDPAADAIVVPIASDDPDVAIFWIYPIETVSKRPVDPAIDSPTVSPGSEI